MNIPEMNCGIIFADSEDEAKLLIHKRSSKDFNIFEIPIKKGYYIIGQTNC